MSAKTVWEEACRLDKHPKVSARIQELRQATEAALAAKRLCTTERLVEEAETNLHAARTANQRSGVRILPLLPNFIAD